MIERSVWDQLDATSHNRNLVLKMIRSRNNLLRGKEPQLRVSRAPFPPRLRSPKPPLPSDPGPQFASVGRRGKGPARTSDRTADLWFTTCTELPGDQPKQKSSAFDIGWTTYLATGTSCWKSGNRCNHGQEFNSTLREWCLLHVARRQSSSCSRIQIRPPQPWRQVWRKTELPPLRQCSAPTMSSGACADTRND